MAARPRSAQVAVSLRLMGRAGDPLRGFRRGRFPAGLAAPGGSGAFRHWCWSPKVREAGLVGSALVREPGLRMGSFVLEALPGGAELCGQGGGHGPHLGRLRLRAGPFLVGISPGLGELGGEPLEVGGMCLPDLIQFHLQRGVGLLCHWSQ